ncbi:hypothetical protein [Microvirga sp. M2]|uniref:hypothetical protein n=1 Tax=Microvirga sp. M2 TaxID=3073270 RepID=UPI0039C3D911
MLQFSGRILATVCIIVALCLGLGAYMSYAAARTTYLDGIAARMRMLAGQVAAAMESSQSMGIAVTEQTAVPGLLTRESKGVPLLLGFVVRLPDRSVLFRSDDMSEGEGQFVVFVPVTNDLGEVTARVEAVYDSGPIGAALSELAWTIGLAALAVALCATALAAMGVLVLLRPMRRLAANPEGRLAESAAWSALRQAHDRIEARLGRAG